MEESLYERLKRHHQNRPCSMHMPGHKQRRGEDALWEGIFSLDVTEVADFDDLHAPEGILKHSMERAARLWGAEESFYLVGSATAGILAGIAGALQRPGKTVLLARNCHKSVYHACEWMQAKTKFITPSWDQEASAFSCVEPEAVEKALEEDPSVALAVITSPTYEGVISDVAAIAEVCHRHGVVLLVDEAHGAHLGLWGVFCDGAVKAGADLVVQSLHKTLPSLTQTGILHARWDRVERAEVKRRLQMTQSSSPSYVLMASMDRCVRWLEQGQEQVFRAWKDRCEALREQIRERKQFRSVSPRGYGSDPTKILVQAKDGTLSGNEILRRLAEEGIFCEMSLGPNALLYTGAFTEEEDVRRVGEALKKLEEERFVPREQSLLSFAPPSNETALSLFEALAMPAQECAYEDLEGKISADYLWAYPPGIPLICPGERITGETVDYLLRRQKENCRLLSASDSPRGMLKVVVNKEK